MIRSQVLLPLAALSAFSGCIAPTEPTEPRVYAADAGTAAEAFAAGETLSTRPETSIAAKVAYNGSVPQSVALVDSVISLTANGQGGITMTVDGQVIDFGAPVNGVYEDVTVDHDYTVGRLAYGGDGAPAYSGPSDLQYVQLWAASLAEVENQQGDEEYTLAIFTIGTETMPEALASLPVAEYSGWSVIAAYPTTAGVVGDEVVIWGSVELSADFGAGTIGGAIDSMVASDGNGDIAIAGTINLNETTIDGNGFSGTLEGDASLANDDGIVITEGSWSGAFYGPAAEEVGGVLWMLIDTTSGATIDLGDDGTIAVGGFVAGLN